MIPILFRAFSTVVTVLIAVVVSSNVGDSGAGKIWAALIIAAVIAIIEWLLIWTPKHFPVARRLLDPRSRAIGIWLQIVRRVVSDGKPDEGSNRFAVFSVDYDAEGYHVAGTAFDTSGAETARWSSTGSPEFSRDGHSMTYRWIGEVIGAPDESNDIDRTGVTSINLSKGTGRVDHVGMKRILLFDLEPVTTKLLLTLGFRGVQPAELQAPSTRGRFAREYAKSLAP